MAELESDLQRGMRLISQRQEVMPEQASGELQDCYQDIQHVLRVPFVNFLFRVLANDPEFLIPAWQALRPWLIISPLEQAADELRAMAVLENQVPEAAGVDWQALGEWEQARRFTDTIHYVLPKLLLVATAFDEVLQRRGAKAAEMSSMEMIPLGLAEGTTKVPMVDPKQATGRLAELFKDIRERHQHPGVASYYRALGNWPDLLEALWQRIAPAVGSPAYEQRKQLLTERAQAHWHQVADPAPTANDLKNELEGEHITELRQILAVFRRRLIPDLMLDVGLIEAMLNGPEAAKRSRFSVAAQA